ncbi:hypothetical protein [Ammoniphilus sp. CFH 90114]|uniref:hypothetical protein n=1 Tax=Ammoniphilus sp. CFH 90114 TaxID=2493665 RepID=UPI0013E916AF|nr:hypothetical protein [Ammoniphilus sp. CFH 90114]
MNPKDANLKKKNNLDDIDRFTNEGLAGGRSGEFEHNGEIDDAVEIPEESPPTINGNP